MATSGSFNTKAYNKRRSVCFSWSRTYKSESGNYSDIHWELKGGTVSNGSPSYYTLHGCYLGITYKASAGADATYHEIYSNSDVNKKLYYDTSIASGDIRVYHEADGSAKIDVALSAAIYTYAISVEGNSTFYIDSIPRATACPNISGTINTSVGVYISPASAEFTHSLFYTFGNLTDYIPINSAWTIPESFYSQIPNTKFGSGTLTLITYANGAEIGRKTGTIYAYCEEAACIPSGTGSIKDINEATKQLTGNELKIIKGESTALITYSATAYKGSSIKSIIINGQEVSVSHSELNILKAQNSVYGMRIIDSRGYFKDITIGDSINLVNYVYPTNNLLVKRNTPTGNQMNFSIDGNFFNQSFGSSQNNLSIKWRVREFTGTFSDYQNINLEAINIVNNTYEINQNIINPLSTDGTWDYQKAYIFEFILQDGINTVPQLFTLKKGKPNHNWYEKNHINFFNVNGKLLLENVDIIEMIYPIGIEITFYDNLDHSNFCGKRWQLVSGGRVDVGRNPNDSRFNSIGITGGNYDLQRHTHSFSGTTSWASLTGRTGAIYSGASSDSERLGIISAIVSSYRQYTTDGERNNKWTYWYVDASHNHTFSGTTSVAGSGDSNMQPYEVKSKWRRIS